jgi:cytosine/adenosine deaminase-related metal-dependent hydrolase
MAIVVCGRGSVQSAFPMRPQADGPGLCAQREPQRLASAPASTAVPVSAGKARTGRLRADARAAAYEHAAAGCGWQSLCPSQARAICLRVHGDIGPGTSMARVSAAGEVGS